MSATEKMPILKTNKTIALIVVLAIVAIVIGLMTPLYLQNEINGLYLKYNKLSEEVAFYESDALQLKLKINQLSSRERLDEFAARAKLGFYAVPVKVMREGGKGE